MRLIPFATVATFLSLLPQSGVAQQIVTFQGIGSVQLGTTAATVEQALRGKLEKMVPISGDDESACWIGRRADGVDPGLRYMFEKGKLTRIDVSGNVARAKTLKNIGINSTENELHRSYGNRVAAKTGDNGATWMTVTNPDKRRSITFEIGEGKVVSFWTAKYPASEYYEGCL